MLALRTAPLVLSLCVLCAACGDDGNDDAASDDTGHAIPEATADAALTYAQIVLASYDDSLTAAKALDDSLQALVDSPSQDTLDAARTAWPASRAPYLPTEVYRFYDGPIDNPTDGPEGLINAWPLDENYIDYVDGSPDAGIINGTDPIDGATLESLNEQGGEKNIATGYHAIEFLLW